MKGNQMSKHTMKRLGFGDYQYRGYAIDRVPCYDNERKFSHWNILDEYRCAVDSANTLAGCRCLIDRWCDDQGEA
jgi:hypothetical protein